MSGTISTSEDALLDRCASIFQAMRAITSINSPEEIVAIIRQHVMPDADCIILIGENISQDGLITARVIVDWDRDGLTHAEPLPDTIRRLVDDHPVVISDIDQIDNSLLSVKPYAESVLQAASLIILPLNRRQHITGYLVLGMHKPHQYNIDQIRHLEILACHIGTVLENRELDNILNRRTAQATLAADLAHDLSDVSDFENLGEIVATRLNEFLPASHISIALITSDHPDAELILIKGEQMPARIPLAGSRIKQAISRDAAILFEELGGWADSSLWQSIDVYKLIVAPLVVGDQILGTLNVGGHTDITLLPDDIPICEQAAVQMAAALQAMRTIKHLESSLDETTMLYSVSLAISAAQHVDEIYATVLEKMADVSGSEHITIYLIGPDPLRDMEYIETTAVWQHGQLIIQSPPIRYLPSQIPILMQFPQSRSNLVFNDLQTDPRLSVDLRTIYVRENVHALMLIPLSSSATWLGTILFEGRQGQTFSGDQARLCRSLADQTALGLNAQLLLARTQQVVGYEQILLNISNRLHSAETTDEINNVAIAELAAVLGLSRDQLAEKGLKADLYPDLTREQRELFENVAVQVSSASENLKLLEQIKKSAAREQIVSNMTAQLQRATDINDVLETTVRTLISALDEYDIKVRLFPSDKSASGDAGSLSSAGKDTSEL
ncbi:MAG: GAF domain-containing protein [Anaerolineae bacterium]|nr:GAF domain-containing protein [Anaerolineae bacterium]